MKLEGTRDLTEFGKPARDFWGLILLKILEVLDLKKFLAFDKLFYEYLKYFFSLILVKNIIFLILSYL